MRGETYQSSCWLILEAAELYYGKHYTQKEVANQLNVSNVTVSRLLQRAKQLRIVRFGFDPEYERALTLSKKIRESYNIEKVIVTDSSFSYDHDLTSKQAVALEGARYIQRVINNDDVLGIAWGKTMYHLVQYLNPCQKMASSFVTLHGSVTNDEIEFDVPSLVKRIAMAMGGTVDCLYLHALQDEVNELSTVKMNKMKESFSKITISVSGVGSLYPNKTSPLLSLKYINEHDQSTLDQAGCYGDFLLRFIDRDGQECRTDLANRTLSISLEDYLMIPQKIVVASGAHKAYTLRAILRGKLADVLIVDSSLALGLIEITE